MAASPNNWGRWGDVDERGALNLLTPERVLKALRACTTGKVYTLAVPIKREEQPVRHLEFRGPPARTTIFSQLDKKVVEGAGASPGTSFFEDTFVIPSHTATHIDALGHVFADDQMYNGFSCDEFSTLQGAQKCGVEKMGGFAGRCVLFDLPGQQGVDWLEPGHAITGDELEACRLEQRVELRQGDIVLIRTGRMEHWASMMADGVDPGPGLDPMAGVGLDAVDYLDAADVSVVGADNNGLEAIPFDRGVVLGVHTELIQRRGIPLIENMKLDEMARDKCYEAFFVLGPLLFAGASASPVTPIAIG